MPDDDRVNCFLSHKCNAPAHAFAEQLEAALKNLRVTLLRDPFETGHEIVTRIHTVAFHSFVFLYSPKSWRSPICREELRIAHARHVPILTVRLIGHVPNELSARLYKSVDGLSGVTLQSALAELATTIGVRARLYKQIEALDPQNDPEETREAAKHLVDDVDRTLIAESLDHIASFYRPETDLTTRFWLALAVGKAGTCKAKETLQRFSWENHPYPQEGIRLAQGMLTAPTC